MNPGKVLSPFFRRVVRLSPLSSAILLLTQPPIATALLSHMNKLSRARRARCIMYRVARCIMWLCVALAAAQSALYGVASMHRTGDRATLRLFIWSVCLFLSLLALELPLLLCRRSGDEERSGGCGSSVCPATAAALLPFAFGSRFNVPARIVFNVGFPLLGMLLLLGVVAPVERAAIALGGCCLTAFGGIFDGLVFGHNENRVGGGRGTANFF